jgi:transposase
MKAHTKTKKIVMWYKVKELSQNEGLNKSQIAKELGIDRGTVRRYLSMDEENFHQWLASPRQMPPKLIKYYDYVKETLKNKPYLSAAQIEDRLRENCSDLPDFHPKTVYNFVRMVRQREGIKKYQREKNRDYEKLPEVKYGSEAQVDFGQYNMRDDSGKHHKVYFFSMVLSRSRYKFVYFQYHPFTTSAAIYAHLLAFDYFQGVPEKIIYDQDRVFMVEENLGDWFLTDEFSRFCQTQPFTPVFCRKADPESKGKIENVVGYIKKNFLRGRVFKNIDLLNKEAKEWLQRTGNRKVHGTTKKVPLQEWKIEKDYLKPPKTQSQPSEDNLVQHTVRKDNSIVYKGNAYTVPTGTYKGRETYVWIEVKDSTLFIYNKDKEIIAQPKVCYLKGVTISNNNHRRDRSTSIREKEKQAYAILGNDSQADHFLKTLHKDKPRYYHDHLRIIIEHLSSSGSEHISKAIDYCIEYGLYNSNQLKEAVAYYEKQSRSHEDTHCNEKANMPEKAKITPEKTDLHEYESIIK